MPQTPSKPTPLSLYVSNPICCLLAPGKRSDRRPGLSLGTPSLHQPGGRQGARGALPAPRRSPGGGPGFYPSPASTPAPPPPPPRCCRCACRRCPGEAAVTGAAARRQVSLPARGTDRPGPARPGGAGPATPRYGRGGPGSGWTPPHTLPLPAPPGGGGGGSNGAGVGRRGAFPGVRSGTGSWCLYNCVCPPAPSCLGAGVGGCVCVPRSPAGRAVPLPGEKGS